MRGLDHRIRLVACAVVLLGACERTTSPKVGALRITVTTTGPDASGNGYSVQLPDRTPIHLDINGSVTVHGLAAGFPAVELAGVPANCSVANGTSRIVTIVPGDVVEVGYQVTCTAALGSLRVVIATGGVDIDAASYSLRIDDEPARSVGVNASILFEDVHQGGHFIHLEAIPANCSVSGSNPATTQVTYKVLSELHIAVTCRAIPGSVRVIVTTTGTDADATGYQLSLAGPDDSRMVVLTANGDVVVAGILPGSYALSLGDVSMNCEASTANPTSTTVAKRDTVIVSIAVTCVPATQLAFMRDRRVYLVNSSGGGLKQIAQGFGQPSWSPDGTKLAVRSYGTGNEEIWLLSLDGSSAVRLTDDAARDNSPAWSPDGTRIAFVSDRSGTAQIQVMNADGSGLTALTADPAGAAEPAWSPDGNRIAYSVGGLSIYVMKSDGSGATKLATGATHPAWSPDGTQIAYAGSAASGSSIFVMNADGSGVRRLTSENDGAPTWSPDGQWIAFVAAMCGDEGCSNRLDVVRANGTRRTRIVGGPVDAPAWRR